MEYALLNRYCSACAPFQAFKLLLFQRALSRCLEMQIIPGFSVAAQAGAVPLCLNQQVVTLQWTWLITTSVCTKSPYLYQNYVHQWWMRMRENTWGESNWPDIVLFKFRNKSWKENIKMRLRKNHLLVLWTSSRSPPQSFSWRCAQTLGQPLAYPEHILSISYITYRISHILNI